VRRVLDFIIFRTIFVLILASPRGTSARRTRLSGRGAGGRALAVAAIILERRIARITLERLFGVVFGVVAGCSAPRW